MNSTRLWIALSVLGLLGLTAIAGYFWSRGPTYGEIEGRVTQGGMPLEHVQVVFYPEEDGPRLWAMTDKDGRFETMTDAIQKMPARRGSPVGKYRVTLVDMSDDILAAEQMARDVSERTGTLDQKQLFPSAQLQRQKKNERNSGVRVPAKYNQRLDTPFNNIEIKSGKNWFDLDVK